MSKIRQKVEREIISQFVQDALASGYRLSVSLERGYDTEDMLLGSRDQNEIVEAALSGDESHIFVQNAEGPLVVEDTLNAIGWVFVVLGNDGWDVISDYTTNLEKLLEGANKLAESYED